MTSSRLEVKSDTGGMTSLTIGQEALGIIHAKVEIYARHLTAGTADQLWRDGPECD
jgi:hypothetical protein